MHATAAHLVSRIVTSTARALWSQPGAGLDGVTTANTRLARYLASKRNARKVQRAVARWRKKARRKNGCVAFVATALRDIGVPVPQDESIDGLAISHITLALSGYLEGRLGWQCVDQPAYLTPGDVVFTEDAVCCPGVPAHVFIFMGWSDRARLIAHVCDEHGNRHPRALRPLRPMLVRSAPSRDAGHGHGHAGSSTSDSPFAYALRQPGSQRHHASSARQEVWQSRAGAASIHHAA